MLVLVAGGIAEKVCEGGETGYHYLRLPKVEQFLAEELEKLQEEVLELRGTVIHLQAQVEDLRSQMPPCDTPE